MHVQSDVLMRLQKRKRCQMRRRLRATSQLKAIPGMERGAADGAGTDLTWQLVEAVGKQY